MKAQMTISRGDINLTGKQILEVVGDGNFQGTLPIEPLGVVFGETFLQVLYEADGKGEILG